MIYFESNVTIPSLPDPELILTLEPEITDSITGIIQDVTNILEKKIKHIASFNEGNLRKWLFSIE